MVLLKTLFIIYPKNDKQNIVIKVCSCSTNQVFLKISQNSQETTCAWASFLNKIAGLQHATLFNKRLLHRCFPVNFAKLLIIPFQQNTSDPLQLRQNFNPRRSRLFYDRRQNFMDPRHPRQNLDPRHLHQLFNPCLNFLDPCHPRHPRQNLTPSTHAPTLPILPTPPRHLAAKHYKKNQPSENILYA